MAAITSSVFAADPVLNDTLYNQLTSITDHTRKIKDYAVNKYWFNDYELD